MAAMGFMTEPARDAIKRLLEAVPDTTAKALIANVLRFAIPALESLTEIDKSMNSYFAFYKDDLGNALEIVISEVQATAFKRVRALIGFLASRDLLRLDESHEGDADFEPSDSYDFSEEFDLGAFEESSIEAPEEEAASMLESVDEIDIEAAFDNIAPEGETTVRQKLDEMNSEIGVIGNALLEQLNTSEHLIGEALDAQNDQAMMRELDVCRDSLSEGLYALLNTIFDLFPGSYDKANLLPGYKDALQKALMIRRGIGDLARAVGAANDKLQHDDLDQAYKETTYFSLLDVLQNFRTGEVFQGMRPPDRWEFSNFQEELRKAGFSSCQLTTESLCRYLESLGVVINQREVLILHDQDVLGTIHECVGAARSLLMVSVAGAKAQLEEALGLASKLHGRNPALDAQLRIWRREPPALETAEEIEEMATHLEELL